MTQLAGWSSTLDAEQRRAVLIVGWISVALLAALTATGTWQFFTHEADPGWFRHQPGSGVRQGARASGGIAELHASIADASTMVALLGSAWIAYKVLHDIPWLGIFALAVLVSGHVTGALIRFNAVRLEGGSYETAGDGYLQLFTERVDVVVTDRYDWGESAIRLLTLSHVLTTPVLLAAAWFSVNNFVVARNRPPARR